MSGKDKAHTVARNNCLRGEDVRTRSVGKREADR